MSTSVRIPPGPAPLPPGAWRTWGDTYACQPLSQEWPTSQEQLAAIVAAAARQRDRVKVVGAGHSFTDIACTDGRLLHLDNYARVLDLDIPGRLVKVQAGMTIANLNVELAKHGLALRNMGDIAYQSIAGAISTSTHGTGATVGNLPSQVQSLELILADGSTLTCSEETDAATFRAALVGLGALGIVSTVTLRCVPAFRLHNIQKRVPLADLLADLDRWVDGNDHFEIFFFPHSDLALAITNAVTTEPAHPSGAVSKWFNSVLLENHAFGVVQRIGRARNGWIPSLNRFSANLMGGTDNVDESYRVFANVRLVRFQEMEYAIPRAAAAAAIGEIRAMIDRLGLRISFPIEVRFGPADDITLSTAHGRDTCYIAVHMFHRTDYETYFREVEAIMNAHQGRPHWGKLHFQTAETLSRVYPKFAEFVAVRDRLDPEGRFTNDYLDRVLGVPAGRA